MTLDELLAMNPNLGKMSGFMKEHPEFPVRFWDDGTVDITIPENVKIASFVAKFRCPCCQSPTEGPYIQTDKEDIKGTFRKCNECSIRFFAHNKVKFGGTAK